RGHEIAVAELIELVGAVRRQRSERGAAAEFIVERQRDFARIVVAVALRRGAVGVVDAGATGFHQAVRRRAATCGYHTGQCLRIRRAQEGTCAGDRRLAEDLDLPAVRIELAPL